MVEHVRTFLDDWKVWPRFMMIAFTDHELEGGGVVYEPTGSNDTTVSISIRRDGGCHRGIRDLDGKRGIVCLVQ